MRHKMIRFLWVVPAAALMALVPMVLADPPYEPWFDNDAEGDAVVVDIQVRDGVLAIWEPDGIVRRYSTQNALMVQIGWNPPVLLSEAYQELEDEYFIKGEKKVNWRLKPGAVDPMTGIPLPCPKGFGCVKI